jgi:prepilin-type N-terminal cleavage/methylation domain-containing protein
MRSDRPRRARDGRCRGFTLIELVTCIVIIGVLAVVAAPRFFTLQPYGARGYAGEIAAALRAARQVAVASACEVQITLDPATGYQAFQRAAAGNTCSAAGAWNVPVRLQDGTVLAGTPPEGIALAPAATITFDGAGRAAGAPATITVATFIVTVDANSGFVSGP